MRIGVYGGTFNPIHTGHIRLAQSYLEALSLDRILVIPANIPPHKRAKQLLPGAVRMELCRLACEEDERLVVSDIELRREGSSYTVDTLRELKALYPDGELFLIVGSDMFLTLETWKESGEIFKLCTICTGAREEGEDALLLEKKEMLEGLGASCIVMDIPVFDISSTEIRRAVGLGADQKMLERWIPAAVAQAILENGYYPEEPETDEAYLTGLAWVKQTLGAYRLFHSRCVADAAAFLAEHHFKGIVDPKTAKLAGLLHDICKDMTKAEQKAWMEKFEPIHDPLILQSPSLWHGFAGASYLRETYGMENEDFLNSIRFHTTARKGMSPLEQTVYLADYISLDRNYPDVAAMRAETLRSPEDGMRYSLRYTVGMLSKAGRIINKDTWEAYNEAFRQE